MLLFLCLFLLFSFSFSVEIFSENLEKLPDGTYKAEGDVEAYYRDYYIKADLMTYDPQKRIVYAKGNVYIRSFDGRFEAKGSEALLDLEKDTGYFLDTEGRFEKFNFSAKRVDKDGENYIVQEGSISTCPPDKKEMNLCFSRAHISQRYVFSQNNTLRLFKIPIVYLPISIFPVGERRSGLLPPTIGSNTYNSFIYQQPIYWAISPDKDATLTLDLRDKQAKGISLEYRQSMRKELDLVGLFSFYKEPTPPGKWWQGRDITTLRENRYRIKGDIDLNNLKAGIDLISDPYFLEDVYLTTKERTVPYLTSYINYTKEWDRFLFTFDLRRFYDTTSSNNKNTLQRLPEIGLYLKDQRLFDFLYFNLSTAYTNFYREAGLKAHRILIFPEFSVPKNILGLNFLSTITIENLLYLNVKGGNFKDKKVIGSVKYVERVPYFFNLNYGGFRTNNLVELSYTYRPKDYGNPSFDNIDMLNKESLMSYTFKSYGYYQERPLYTLFLEGCYNYLGKFNYLGQEIEGKVLPIRSIFQLYPVKNLSLTTDSTYDLTHGRFLRTIGSLTFSYKNNSLSLGKVLERNYNGLKINDQYSLSAFSSYGPLKISLGMIRDNNINKDIQRQLNLDYRGACWSFGLMLRDTYDGTKQKYIKEIFLTFNIFDLQKFTVPLKR